MPAPTTVACRAAGCIGACPGRRVERGLSLLEVLIGLALSGILIGMAAPSFEAWMTRVRAATQGSALASSMSYAKSESLRRGLRVTVCPSADPTAASPACSAVASWAQGWLVFADNVHLAGNAAGVVDGADEILRIGEPMDRASVSVTGVVAHWVGFSPAQLVRGSGGVGGGTISLCQGPYGRTVVIDATGRTTATSIDCAGP